MLSHRATTSVRAWVANHVADDIAAEAAQYPRHETGGMLLGYWMGDQVVVTATIGPGPNARRGPTWLEPDHEWQLRELADTYARTGRVTTYLGDWHTHPGAVPVPSRRDKRTLRAVRRSPTARADMPLSMIVGPRLDDTPVLWCLAAGRRPVAVTIKWFDA